MTFATTDTLIEVKAQAGGRDSWYQFEPPQPGYSPSSGVVWVAASAGRVRFVAETVTYGGVGTRFAAFGLVLTPKGEVMLGGGATPSTSSGTSVEIAYNPCDGPTSGAHYVGGYSKVGVTSGYGLYGRFLSIRTAGRNVVVTSTYPWGTKGQRATEIDTISATTYLPSRTVIHISAARGVAAFTLAYRTTWYHTPLSPPKSTGVCSTYLKSVP